LINLAQTIKSIKKIQAENGKIERIQRKAKDFSKLAVKFKL
jgi:hypothetical protein